MDILILTSLLVSMGISMLTSKDFLFFCRVSKIGNDYDGDFPRNEWHVDTLCLLFFLKQTFDDHQ